MRVLVACEFSGVVRDAFLRRGHDAVSCDILPTHSPGPHVQGDVLALLDGGWDLMVAHPPCTHLAVSGAKHFGRKKDLQEEALRFFCALLNAPIPQIAVENPVGVVSTRIRPPDQVVQPYWFGDPERKATCLWLKALPKLRGTDPKAPQLIHYPNGKTFSRFHDHSRSVNGDRGLGRSVTFPGLAEAMAEQWGSTKDHCWRSEVGYRVPDRWVVKPR